DDSDDDSEPEVPRKEQRRKLVALPSELAKMPKFSGMAGESRTKLIEELETAADFYGLEREDLIRALPTIFTGPALRWIKFLQPYLSTWQQFKRAFYDKFRTQDYMEELET